MSTKWIQDFTSTPLAVHTRGLTKRYGSRLSSTAPLALAGLDLAVPEGRVYVLVGPNGAGKTTAIKVLQGILPADGGTAEILGLPMPESGPQARLRIGWVPESSELGGQYGEWRVDDLLAFHATYYPAWDTDYARQLRGLLEVEGRKRYGKLSKGQARRVQLVMALAHRPLLLLLDEPTDGLDPLAQDQFTAVLAEHLADSPATALISTHRVHEVEGLGEVLGVLRGGRLKAQLERDQLTEHLRNIRTLLPLDAPEARVEELTRGFAELGVEVLTTNRRGREMTWTLWGDEERIRSLMSASELTLRAVDNLNLEQACRALLAYQGPQAAAAAEKGAGR